MRHFVTGATGFVGSHLTEALLARGDEVVALVRSPAKAARIFTDLQPQIVQGDLGDSDALRRAVHGADIVHHVAGLTSARRDPEFFAVNRDGTRRVLEAAREAAPGLRRIVHVSSVAASGPSPRGTPIDERAAPRPVSTYGASKLAGEEEVRRAGIPWTIVRPPAVYGPRDVELRRVFAFGKRGIVPVFGDGRQELSLIHVADLVSALLAACDRGHAEGTYFACHPEVLTSEEFAVRITRAVQLALTGKAADPRLVVRVPDGVARVALWINGAAARAVGRSTVLSGDKIPELLAPAWTCSPAALERDTGWQARISAAEGLPQTAAWYRDTGWL